MLNKHLFFFLLAFFVGLPVTHVSAQPAENPDAVLLKPQSTKANLAEPIEAGLGEITFGEDTPPEFRKAVQEFYGHGEAFEKLRKKIWKEKQYRWEDGDSVTLKAWALVSRFAHPSNPIIVAKTWDKYKWDAYGIRTNNIDVLYSDAPALLMLVMRPAESTHCEKWTCTRQLLKSNARTDYFVLNEKSKKVFWIGSIKFFNTQADQVDPTATLRDKLVRDVWKMAVTTLYGENALK